jgi:maleylacetate reductase
MEIQWGPASQLVERLAGRRVLIVCGPTRRGVEALAPLGAPVFDGAKVHVPADVVARAEAALGDAETVVAIGGGAAIGLGKALRLRRDVGFVAVPSTYAGSERTNLYGITAAGAKQTGRDDRVRPELIVYDVELTLDMPIGLTVQSGLNAVAHCASVLSTDSLAGDDRAAALATITAMVRALGALLRDPRDRAAREQALRAASSAGEAADRGQPGSQHRLAHTLGGALGLDHAALHSVLLPRFLAHLRAARPPLAAELDAALGGADLEALLRRAGVATRLDELLLF